MEEEEAVLRPEDPVPKMGCSKASNEPRDYMKNPDAEKNVDVEDILKRWDKLIPADKMPVYEAMVRSLHGRNLQTPKEFDKACIDLRREFKKECPGGPKKSELAHAYNVMVVEGKLEDSPRLKELLVKKSSKSQSGVLVITVLTSPYPKVGKKVQRFSCEWNCYYCPNEPGQPRSYLHDEPSVLRANANNFDPVLQFTDRATTLAMNGHPVDKIEILVLGGTWASYPHQYQEEFVRDLFFAANTCWQAKKRERLSLEEEQQLNESASAKIIGLTLETRPDTITDEELLRYRRYGCTRVQLGIQHTDDGILKKINRGHDTQSAVDAIRRLKNACYKIDIHLMPNLPGSSPEMDLEMFNNVLHNPDLQVDQWKIYPCEVTPWTVIKKWYDEGSYVPYSDTDLFELLMKVKPQVHPWIRLNRVVRDIPSQYILGGLNAPNLRQDAQKVMKDRGIVCKCIRCREVGGNKAAMAQAEMVIREYVGSNARELFISFETPDRRLICGFVRLRLGEPEQRVFPELEGAALVRELHVYGQLVATEDKANQAVQHVGFGRQMMEKAEEIALEAGYRKMAVIAGIGTRNYYRKLGYELEGIGQFMIKHIKPPSRGWFGSFLQAMSGKRKRTKDEPVSAPRAKKQDTQDVEPPANCPNAATVHMLSTAAAVAPVALWLATKSMQP